MKRRWEYFFETWNLYRFCPIFQIISKMQKNLKFFFKFQKESIYIYEMKCAKKCCGYNFRSKIPSVMFCKEFCLKLLSETSGKSWLLIALCVFAIFKTRFDSASRSKTGSDFRFVSFDLLFDKILLTFSFLSRESLLGLIDSSTFVSSHNDSKEFSSKVLNIL